MKKSIISIIAVIALGLNSCSSTSTGTSADLTKETLYIVQDTTCKEYLKYTYTKDIYTENKYAVATNVKIDERSGPYDSAVVVMNDKYVTFGNSPKHWKTLVDAKADNSACANQ